MAEDEEALRKRLAEEISKAYEMLNALEIPGGQRQSGQQASELSGQNDSNTTVSATQETGNESVLLRKEILSGKTLNLPTKKSNVFRIFMSSTFTDMALERNTLMSSVFPELKKYCKDKYNHEFQVVDMRWGVQDQASDDHSTSELCMNELRNCQKESAGPTFVCLLGDRYGTRFLRKYIPFDHWNLLLNHIDDQQVLSLLNTWYKRDDNASPSHYVLQSISSITDGDSEWKNHSENLHQAVKEAAIRARTAGDMTEDVAQIYIRSVTEEELEESGMFKEESPYKHSILACFRSLTNINHNHSKAWRFIDQDNDKNVDLEAQELLAKLKDRVKQCLPADQQLDYKITWSDDGGMNESDHFSHLKSFSEDFKLKLIEMIDKSMTNQSPISQVLHDDTISHEVASHLQQAVTKGAKVVPRSDILDQIKDYVCGTSTSPLVVYGHSGCGKTSIMALCALKMLEWLDEGDVHLIVRFLGTTPASSEFELMLRHLRAQLESLTKPEMKPAEIVSDCLNSTVADVNDLITQFQMTLNSVHSTQTRFIIILDSIDQLRENKTAYDLSWLPTELPPNVKLIISTLPDLHGILQSARSLPIPDTNFVEVKALHEKGAWSILDFWLEGQQKQLTESQRESVSSVLHGREITPLYVKLIYNIISTWKSYTPITSLPVDVFSCLEDLFFRVETVHGELQVKHALGYITCCPGGVSQVELEDILSLDDVYLTTVYQYHIPPVRRIPPLLWVRIRSDISDYLVEKESDGVAAMSWYHRQFLEYAQKRFIDSLPEKSSYYTDILKEYFEGRWASLEKPFTYNERQMKKLGVSDPNSQALRYVDPQDTRSGVDTYNLRKIYVLNALYTQTQYLPQSDKQQVAEMAAANLSKILMDLEFFTGRFVYGSFGPGDLMNLLKLVHESCRDFSQLQYKDLTPVERFCIECRYLLYKLQIYYSTIKLHAKSLASQLFYYFKDKVNVTSLISIQESQYPSLSWLLMDILTGLGIDLCPLVTIAMPTETASDGGGSGRELIISREMEDPCYLCTYVGHDGNTIACAANGKSLVLFKITPDAVVEIGEVKISIGISHVVYIPPDIIGEDFLLAVAASCEHFALVSLKAMKQIPSKPAEKIKLAIPNRDYPATLEVDWCIPLRNPWLRGKDSVLFFAAGRGLAVLFSYKVHSVVWYRYTTPNCKVQHIGIRHTEQAHIKHLVLTVPGTTEIYELKLQEDGNTKVVLVQTVANSFHRSFDPARNVSHARMPNLWIAGLADRNVNICVRTTNTPYIAVASKHPSHTQEFNFYPITQTFIFLAVGQLKSGTQLLITHDTEVKSIELYTISMPDLQLKFSARIAYPDEKVLLADMASSSNVLGIIAAQTFYVYYIEELDDMRLKVTPVHKLVPETDTYSLVDLQLDPYGYLVYTTVSDGKVIDLTAGGTGGAGVNPYIRSRQSAMHTLLMPSPYQVVVILQEVAHIWDTETNEWLGKLNRADGYDKCQAQSFTYQPIEAEEGRFHITVDYSTVITVHKVDIVQRPVTTELIYTIQVDKGSEVIPFTNVLLSLNDDTGLLKVWQSKNMDRVDTFTLSANLRGSGFSATQLYPLDYCYAEDFLIISAQIGSGSKDVILIYDCHDSFKLVKQIQERYNVVLPSSFIYIKCLKTVIGSSGKSLFWRFDCQTKEEQTVKVLQWDDTMLLENYDRMYQPFMVKDDPEIHIIANHSNLVSLDVRQFSDWPTGAGIVEYGGPKLEGTSRVTVSYNCNYMLTSTYGSLTDIVLYKLYHDESAKYKKLMGHYTILSGSADQILISYDERYVTAVLSSGEIHCMKILDKERENLQSEMEAFFSRFPPVPSEDEVDEDKRWKSMKAFESIQKGSRTRSYLEDWAKSMIPGKESYPVVGTEEFEAVYGESIPFITAESLSEEENQRLHEEGMKIYEKSLPYLSNDSVSASTEPDNSTQPVKVSDIPGVNQVAERLLEKSHVDPKPEDQSVEQLPAASTTDETRDNKMEETTTQLHKSDVESKLDNQTTGQLPATKEADESQPRNVEEQLPTLMDSQLQDGDSLPEGPAISTSVKYSQPLYSDLPAEKRAAVMDGVANQLDSKSKVCILL